MMGTEIIPETSVSIFNQLTRLCAREDFIEQHSISDSENLCDNMCRNLLSLCVMYPAKWNKNRWENAVEFHNFLQQTFFLQ
jgi:hypothetical protein